MTLRCAICGATDDVKFIAEGVERAQPSTPDTFMGQPLGDPPEGEYLTGRFACPDHRASGASDASEAGYDPAGPEWLPDDVREVIGRTP